MNPIKTALRLTLAVAASLVVEDALAQSTECPSVAARPGQRYLVAISDLHFGLGRRSGGAWDPREDFRWSGALRGFLDRISRCGADRVDLVVAGDMLELWQPPDSIECVGARDDLGCTLEQMTRITQAVTAAHTDDLKALGRFASRGDNHLFLVPGNHDAALLLEGPWQLVHAAMEASANRATRVDSGVWVSPDGKVVIEHGHQIGQDVNNFAKWPAITERIDGVDYLVRPWGERFVQKIFNEQELVYSIIDNLSPEAAGVRYRMADRGLWSSIDDLARFLAFNVFETSLAQKAQFLGGNQDPNAPPPPWDLKIGRGFGHLLFVDALPVDDPFRASLLADTPESSKLRTALDAMARDENRLTDAEVEMLCDQIAIRTSGKRRCQDESLGALAQQLLRSKRAVLTEHLQGRLAQSGLRQMRVFVYAHTHELEEAWPVQVTDLRSVMVLNTGAFQRVINEDGFLSRAKAKNLPPAEALRQLTPEDLPPCYTAVVVAFGDALPEAQTVRWHMEEGKPGGFVNVGNAACN